jgi:hypothetical protein
MKAKKTYAKGGPITPDPKKKMMTADEKFNAAARSREAENLNEMRNALKEEGKEAVAKFDKELKAKGYKVISRNVKKMPGGGMMPKYKEGGTVPGKDTWVGKGRQPNDPQAKGAMTNAEYLERLTWQKAVEALDKRGVSMVDQSNRSTKILGQGNPNVLDNNYELAIKKAKEYGVYDQARQAAVAEYRSKKDSPGEKK